MTRIAVTLLACASGVFAQSAPAPKFEVASIKPSDPTANGFRIGSSPGGRFTASGVTAKMLITQAYGVRDFQVIGGPSWLDGVRFDITAKAENGADIKPGEMGGLLRGLLEDRFQLKIVRETKEMPIYALVVAKNGSKLKESTVSAEGRNMRMGRGRLVVQGGGMPMLATQLAQSLGRKVVDKTGLTAGYDFTLEWTPEGHPLGPKDGEGTASIDSSGPTIFTALQEQLGLKLESTKGPVEVLVIERVEKPTEN